MDLGATGGMSPFPGGAPGACPTCGERDVEDIGDDVRRCRNCTFLWVVEEPPTAREEGPART